MVLAKRIIPCLDVDSGKVVKGVSFLNLRDAGDPAELTKRYCEEGADELVLLDITASPEKRELMSETVRRVASGLNIPFTVGGGIRSIDDARAALRSGADKISVNTAVVENPDLIRQLASTFGTQCVVVAIDAKRRTGTDGFEVYTYGARKATGMDAIEWAKEAEKLGAGELLITSIDRDGTEKGYDIAQLSAIAKKVRIPIIASGGCGTLDHFSEVFQKGQVDAALAASVFHDGVYTVGKVKNYLKSKGIVIRK